VLIAGMPAGLVPSFRASTASASATNPIALGVFIDDVRNNMSFTTPTSNPASLGRYASMVGRIPAVVMWYQPWTAYYPGFPVGMANAVVSRGSRPMITWMPGSDSVHVGYSCRDVSSGRYDSYIRGWAKAAKAWGHPFFLRFAYEMNGNWFPWGTSPGNLNHNTPAQYIAEWRHVHDIFASVGASNAIWVWAPNKDGGPTTIAFAKDYPGDAYVDWVGIDAYNWGSFQPHSRWRDFHDVMVDPYTQMTALTPKPMMVAETATPEIGGNKALWITDAFLTSLPVFFPRLRALIWFDAKKETDWRVNSSSASLTAYRRIVASPLDQGRF